MRNIKKFFSVMIVIAIALVGCLSSFGTVVADAKPVLRVYNWADYIYDALDDDGNPLTAEGGEEVPEALIAAFEKEYDCVVEYTTFATNEEMLAKLELGSARYDLCCPSDYIIEKLYKENKIQPFKTEFMSEYLANVSPYIDGIIKTVIPDQTAENIYTAGYMWGTMGIVYNPEEIGEDADSWTALWNEEYKGKFTIKDSVRDSYFMALGYVCREELNALDKTAPDYGDKVLELFNRTDDETLAKVEEALKTQKEIIYGFEVDEGKNDMISGKIAMNFCWAGDGVYAMDLAEEEGVILNYNIPKEGSNVFFDGWVIPKNSDQAELASKFVNFLSRSSNAVLNMDKIGYTSVIAGDDVLDLVWDWYGDEEGEYEVDLTYFFNGTLSDGAKSAAGNSVIVKTSELGRQFSAQYPDEATLERCAVMHDYGDRAGAVNAMWERVKAVTFPTWLIWVICVAIVAIIAAVVVYAITHQKPKRREKMRTRH